MAKRFISRLHSKPLDPTARDLFEKLSKKELMEVAVDILTEHESENMTIVLEAIEHRAMLLKTQKAYRLGWSGYKDP